MIPFRVINECITGKHDCSSSASCIDTADLFTCRCRDGFRDESPDLVNRPGRVCVRGLLEILINESELLNKSY